MFGRKKTDFDKAYKKAVDDVNRAGYELSSSKGCLSLKDTELMGDIDVAGYALKVAETLKAAKSLVANSKDG